jgi:hypothetical protein
MERATITSSFTKRQGFSSHQRTDNKAPSYRLLLQDKIKRKKSSLSRKTLKLKRKKKNSQNTMIT